MPANSLENWAYFFFTAAGVSATLAGLVIVAVSVNIQQILKHPQLPPRASATVVVLMLPVIIGLAALIPQSVPAFAVETFVVSAVGWLILLACSRKTILAHLKSGRSAIELVVGLTGGHIAAVALLMGGGLLWYGHAEGLYWIATGTIAALIFAVLNAWVFLIEVLR